MSIPETDPTWGHLERLRAEELRRVLGFLPAGARVLELGAGSGFQSAWLTRLGFRMSAVDVEEGGEDFPVQIYDGVHLPFDDRSFDVVFSSNVLEHVRDIPGLLSDVRRVMALGGLIVAILPSSTWRLWTTVAHYPFLMKFALTRRLPTPSRTRAAATLPVSSFRHKLRRAIVPGAHGEFPSAAHELYTFRRAWWIHQLNDAGFGVRSVQSLRLFYTGYSLVEGAPISVRRLASRVLGSSTYVLVADVAAQ